MCVHVYVSVPEAINYILVIFNLCNQLNKFATFRNVMKQFFVWAWPLLTKYVVTETNLISVAYAY